MTLDKRAYNTEGWNLWLTDDAVIKIKERLKGKAKISVKKYNCGTINLVNIKNN